MDKITHEIRLSNWKAVIEQCSLPPEGQTYVKTLDGKEQENSYGGESLRAGISENGKKTTFLYHDGEILAECDKDSASVKRYLTGLAYPMCRRKMGPAMPSTRTSRAALPMSQGRIILSGTSTGMMPSAI